MRARNLLRAVLFASVAVFINCSVQNPAISGTETGNPAIIACLESALETADSTDSWLPSHYLVSGETQLCANSEADYSGNRILAKKTAANTEDTLPHTDTIYDTVIQPHVIYVNDTTVRTHLKTDTSVNDDGSIIYKTFHIKDTLIIKDTLYKTDTTIVIRNIIAGGTNWNNSSVVIVFESDSVHVPLNEAIKMVDSSDSERIDDYLSSISPGAALNRYDSSVYSLGRYSSVNGITISEMYSGIDDDSGLYTAPSGTVAAVRLKAHYEDGNSAVMNLEVDFDAGTDGKISTAYNNRILRISRITKKNNVISENISYCNFSMAQNSDTATLLITRNKTEKSENIRYFQIQGSDSLNHNLNMLVSINKKVEFKNDSVKTIAIDMIPERPVEKGYVPEKVQIRAFIDMGIGRSGEINGQIDNKKRMFSGEYAYDGTEYIITYDYITGKLTKEKK